MKVENPTSRDIADIAGVSQATVSRALRNSPLVKKETRDRIQKIARELKYFVNRNAAGLRTHQSNTLALLMFEDANEAGEPSQNLFLLTMLDHITRAAASHGYDVLVSLQQLHNDWHIEYQASHRADGLILLGYGDYLEYREKLEALSEAHTRFIIWGPTIDDQPGHSFGCDNLSGGYQATQHLVSIGRKRIAFFGSRSRRMPELADRYKGYRRALDEAGLGDAPDLFVDALNSEQQGYNATISLIESGHPFDAIFAVTDLIAIGALRALKERGFVVPRDVSVVGFDDMPLASHVSPALTTVEQNARTGAEGLVQGIVGLIEGEPFTSRLVAPKLVVRESCGAKQ